MLISRKTRVRVGRSQRRYRFSLYVKRQRPDRRRLRLNTDGCTFLFTGLSVNSGGIAVRNAVVSQTVSRERFGQRDRIALAIIVSTMFHQRRVRAVGFGERVFVYSPVLQCDGRDRRSRSDRIPISEKSSGVIRAAGSECRQRMFHSGLVEGSFVKIDILRNDLV